MDKKKSIINIQDLGLSAARRFYKLFIKNFLFSKSFLFLEKELSIFRKFFKISADNRYPK
jgi:hypothetical protein